MTPTVPEPPQRSRPIGPARRVGRFEWERTLRADLSLPWETRSIGLLVATYMSRDGGGAWPSVGDNDRRNPESLTAMTGRSRSVLLAHLAALRDAGYSTVEPRPGRPSWRIATIPNPSDEPDGYPSDGSDGLFPQPSGVPDGLRAYPSDGPDGTRPMGRTQPDQYQEAAAMRVREDDPDPLAAVLDAIPEPTRSAVTTGEQHRAAVTAALGRGWTTDQLAEKVAAVRWVTSTHPAGLLLSVLRDCAIKKPPKAKPAAGKTVRCPIHLLSHWETGECSSCRADRIAS